MNPFVLNKMHGAFVPDRLTDIAATTPAVSPEPTVQPQHTHTQSFPKYIGLTSYHFDVAHRGDIAMLMEDDCGVRVICDVVVEDDCRGVDMLSHVFGFAVMPKMAVFIEHDGRNTASVMDMLHRLYRFEDTLIFVVVTHTDNNAAMELVAALMLDNVEPFRRTYGRNSTIYYNPTMIAHITEHEQGWHDLVPLTEGRDKPAVGADIDSNIRQLNASAKHFMSQADMARYLDDIPDKDYEPSCVTVDYRGSLDRYPTLDRAVQHIQITPIVDTEYYRHLRQNMGLPTKPTTESHALRISELPPHVHVGSDNERRVGMITGVPEQERFFVPHGRPITTNTNDLIAMMAEAGVHVTIGADIGLESKDTPPMRHTHQDYRDGQWHAPYTDDDSKLTK